MNPCPFLAGTRLPSPSYTRPKAECKRLLDFLAANGLFPPLLPPLNATVKLGLDGKTNRRFPRFEKNITKLFSLNLVCGKLSFCDAIFILVLIGISLGSTSPNNGRGGISLYLKQRPRPNVCAILVFLIEQFLPATEEEKKFEMGSGKYESFKYHYATERTGKGPITCTFAFSPTQFSFVFEQVQPGPKGHFDAFFPLFGLCGAHFALHAKSRLIYGWDGFFLVVLYFCSLFAHSERRTSR